MLIVFHFFIFLFRLTVIPAPLLFPRQSSYLTRSPAVWSSSKISNEFLHTGRDCIEGNPPGTTRAAFVLWATQLDQVRVHSDEFATGTVRRVLIYISIHSLPNISGFFSASLVFTF